MENLLGHDFSHIRIHADSVASSSALALSARAYTLGRDLVFAPGEYAPTTAAGRELIAHELVHSLQQHGRSSTQEVSLDSAPDTLEQEAAAASQEAFTANWSGRRAVPRPGQTVPGVQRKISVQTSNQGEVVQFFRRHGFTNYKVEADALGARVVETDNDERPPTLEGEILWALARSRRTYIRSLDGLRRDINNRISIVHAARMLAHGRHGRRPAFGTFVPEKSPFVTFNDKFWQQEQPLATSPGLTGEAESQGIVEFDVVIRTRPESVTPSQAIEDIWRHPELYAYECYSSTAVIQYRAQLLRLGEERFNRLYHTDGIVLSFRARTQQAEILAALKERVGLEEVDVGSTNDFRELIPGDQVFFQFPRGGGENAIYVGSGRFFAHPLGIVDDPQRIAAYYHVAGVQLTASRWRIEVN